MKLRQLARRMKARVWAEWAPVRAGRRLLARDAAPYIPAPGQVLTAEEAAKVEFVCERVKDGVVVDTFDSREDALALLLKHYKQKKAKLQVRNSYTGELEVFTEEEAVL